MEKNTFSHEPQQFRWWCEVENPSTAFSSCWSILHDCAKISHGNAKSLFTFPLCAAAKLILFYFAWLCEIEKMLFRLLFAISPIFSFLIHLHHLQLSSKVWSKCISSSSSSTLCTLLHSIFHLSLHASKVTLKYLQNSTKNH